MWTVLSSIQVLRSYLLDLNFVISYLTPGAINGRLLNSEDHFSVLTSGLNCSDMVPMDVMNYIAEHRASFENKGTTENDTAKVTISD